MDKLFPKRLKLQVVFKGALAGKTPEVFNYKTVKEVDAKEEWYKSVYKPDVVEFVRTPGMIQVKNKPQELVGTAIMEAAKVEDIFDAPPMWAGKDDTIWGQGFENTWYVATPDFTEVVKLKKA